MKKIFAPLLLFLSLVSPGVYSQVPFANALLLEGPDLWDGLTRPRFENEMSDFQKLILAYQKWPQFTEEEWLEVLAHSRKYGPSQINSELHTLWSEQSSASPLQQALFSIRALLESGLYEAALRRAALELNKSPEQIDLLLLKIEAALLAGQLSLVQDLLFVQMGEVQLEQMVPKQKIRALLLRAWVDLIQNEKLRSLQSLERARFVWKRGSYQNDIELAVWISSLDFLLKNYPYIPSQLSPSLSLDSSSLLSAFSARHLVLQARILSGQALDLEKEIRHIAELFRRGLQFEVAYIRFGFLDSLRPFSDKVLIQKMSSATLARQNELQRLRSSRSLEALIDQHFLASIEGLGPAKK